MTGQPGQPDQPLFDVEPYEVEPGVRLSPDQARTRRQSELIALGYHPLNGLPLHENAAPEVRRNGSTAPYTCGSCRFREKVGLGMSARAYAKCLRDLRRTDQDAASAGLSRNATKTITHGPATDVRSWWPACTGYEMGDPGVSPDAMRVTPETP